MREGSEGRGGRGWGKVGEVRDGSVGMREGRGRGGKGWGKVVKVGEVRDEGR